MNRFPCLRVFSIIAVATFMLAPESALAQTQAQTPQFLQGWKFGGSIDGYYTWNFNRPPDGKNALYNFNFNHNQFNLNLIEATAEKTAAPLGYRMDLNFGQAADWVNAADPAGGEFLKYVQQAYLSYKPGGGKLQVDFGKYVTQHGAEVIESKDNWNYSRSLLFAWAIPYYHFGFRTTYTFNDHVTLGAGLSNGWNNVVDNNSGKTFGAQVLVKGAGLTYTQNYMFGREQTNNTLDTRHLIDSTLIYDATAKISLMANYDYGMDRVSGQRVRWQGIGTYARFSLLSWFKVTPRYEWYDDPHGFTTGRSQTVQEFTATAEFVAEQDLLIRTEWRRDWSDVNFFRKRGGRAGGTPTDKQDTLTLGLIYIFAR